jgi:hypothetical protein
VARKGTQDGFRSSLRIEPAGLTHAWRRARPQKFAKAIHAKFPGKLLAYNCSPSFNWKKRLTDAQIASFQQDLSNLGGCPAGGVRRCSKAGGSGRQASRHTLFCQQAAPLAGRSPLQQQRQLRAPPMAPSASGSRAPARHRPAPPRLIDPDNPSSPPAKPPGYKFQFVTLAGFHALNFSMFSLAKEYASRGMSAYADLQVCVGLPVGRGGRAVGRRGGTGV